ncbi:MAG: hypothetical protein EZS28_048329, partial [Streblomastix strix]
FSNGESTSTIERIAAVSLGEQISFADVGYRSRQSKTDPFGIRQHSFACQLRWRSKELLVFIHSIPY